MKKLAFILVLLISFSSIASAYDQSLGNSPLYNDGYEDGYEAGYNGSEMDSTSENRLYNRGYTDGWEDGSLSRQLDIDYAKRLHAEEDEEL